MIILLTGATGFVGRALALRLFIEGHDLHVLSRDARSATRALGVPVRAFDWNPTDAVQGFVPPAALQGVGAVIHLAGEPVASSRWTDARKRAIHDSRALGTRRLVDAILARPAGSRPRAVVSASAVGIYGDRGDAVLDETSRPGAGFLAEVCRDWEAPIAELPSDVRSVIARIGVVLGRADGKFAGALEKLVPLFRAGVGGRAGSGDQWMSWIHVDDLVEILARAAGAAPPLASRPELRGTYNAVAPGAVTNRDFSAALGRAMGVPALVPAPALAIRAALGEMADGAVLASQHVKPRRLAEAGFRFAHPELDGALAALELASRDDRLESAQWVDRPVAEIFEFFASERNLERITPPWLNFRVVKMSTPTIGEGTVIDYRLKIHGLPIRWRSRIEGWDPGQGFVDTQLRRPYSYWHHTHAFESLRGGTLMRDRVRFRVPMGRLGRLVSGGFVRKDVETIFSYRTDEIRRLFP